MSYTNILCQPDIIIASDTAFGIWGPVAGSDIKLTRLGEAQWTGGGVEIDANLRDASLEIIARSPQRKLRRLHLRWLDRVSPHARYMGDEWERSYGDMEWRGLVPDRCMPWYFHQFDGERTHCYGVKTQPAAMSWWNVDNDGISLWFDVRCGGEGVALGDRELRVATVIAREGREGESPFAAAKAFARMLCDKPRLAPHPLYGHNSYYYTHAQISPETEISAAARVADLSPSTTNRPYEMVDGGWSRDKTFRGPWDELDPKFPDMAKLADCIRNAGARPGIWIRCLAGNANEDPALMLPDKRLPPGIPLQEGIIGPGLDPSIPEVLDRVRADIKRLCGWGYEMIKHDFSTIDIMGRFGYEMHGRLNRYWGVIARDGWSFNDTSRTTAEIIIGFYRAIREAAGDTLIMGCNTIGHLSAGLFEVHRCGEDNFGDWSSTRRHGINTVAFRMPQGTFHTVHPDCVPITKKVPWKASRHFLELVSRSGSTLLFTSHDPEVSGPEQEKALREAYRLAAEPQPMGEPLDWLDTTCPQQWNLGGETVEFDWYDPAGVDPFIWR